jgi:hypothetical protein
MTNNGAKIQVQSCDRTHRGKQHAAALSLGDTIGHFHIIVSNRLAIMIVRSVYIDAASVDLYVAILYARFGRALKLVRIITVLSMAVSVRNSYIDRWPGACSAATK